MMRYTMPKTCPTLGQLLSDLSLADAEKLSVGPLVLDSRRVTPGDTFVALAGAHQDGSQFIDQALQQGAGLILTEGQVADCTPLAKSVYQVTVPELRQRLSAIAGAWFGAPSQSMSMVAITGTNGKTTCSHWLAQVLNAPQTPAASIGTLGYGLAGQPLTMTGLTTPDAIATQQILAELKADGAGSVVMEVSSHSLDQGRVAGVEFDVAVFTNIGRDHLDYHGSMDNYVASKTRLMKFSSLRAAVINLDDLYADFFLQALLPEVKRLTYSLREAADFGFKNIEYRLEGVAATLITPEGNFDVELPVWGEFNLQNILAVLATGYSLCQPLSNLVAALPRLQPVAGRLELVDRGADLTVLVDFAHTPDALCSVLSAIRQHSTQRLWCVFGCGGDRDSGKRPLMAEIAEHIADEIVVTSDNPRSESPQEIINDVMGGFARPEKVHSIPDREAAIRYAINNASAGDCILIAGKGHENYQLIGSERLPFSDVAVARLALKDRAEQQSRGEQQNDQTQQPGERA